MPTLPTGVMAALRYAIALLMTHLVSSGRISAETAEGLASILVTAAVVGYGILKTQKLGKEAAANEGVLR